jgi:hypothetical protein
VSPDALAQLDRWGLDEGDTHAAGIFETPSARAIYGEMAPEPAIVIPYFEPSTGLVRRFERNGAAVPYARLRWLKPPVANGHGFGRPRIQRYSQPARSGVAAYFPPCLPWRDLTRDASVGLLLTEGEAKAVAAARHGWPAIAFGGVYSFADRQGELLPELDAVAWRGRDVCVVYDSDAAFNPAVLAAEARLVEALQRQRGARVRIVRLPQEGDEKVGLDDFLKARGAGALQALIRETPSLSILDAKVIALNQRCAWVERESMVWDLEQRMLVRKDSFVAGSRHSVHVHYTQTGKTPKEINVAQAWLRHPHAQRFSEILFRPNEGQVVMSEASQPALNMWTGWRAEPGDVSPFLDLTEHIFKNMRLGDRDLPLNLVAYKAQHPDEKIPLALVMVGPQGGGKSMWAECVRQAFEPWGVAISAEQMTAQFNGWLERSLIAVVNEVGAETIAGAPEKIRSLISELRTPMEEKFRPLREVNSYTFYIMNSNKRAVGAYGFDDRRMIVIDTPPPLGAEFYAAVHDWLLAGGGRKLMHWLLNVDLGAWKPPQRAPLTDEKIMAFHEGQTPIQELAHSMRTAKLGMVEVWLDAAERWAKRAELSNNLWQAQLGQAVLQNLNSVQIKPWYTSAELAMLFPSIVEQTLGSRLSRSTAAGQISRELREAGIPFLRNIDDARGFWHRGQLKQYLIVSDFEEWEKPIKQADFNRLVDAFPTYAQVKQARIRK